MARQCSGRARGGRHSVGAREEGRAHGHGRRGKEREKKSYRGARVDREE
jgi:hypothetical protein